MSVVCTYDNPATMQRECWQNGVLIRAYSATLYALKVWPVPPEHYFFGANVGDWKTGQLHGDASAMQNLRSKP
jgi:hypothetical protein